MMRRLAPLLLLALLGVCVLSTAPLARPPIDDDGLPRVVLPAVPDGLTYIARGTDHLGGPGFFTGGIFHDVGVGTSGNSLVVCFGLMSPTGGDVSGVTWGGVPLTLVNNRGNGDLLRGDIWYLSNATAGTHNLEFSFSDDTESYGVSAIEITGGVTIVDPLMVASAIGTSTTPSVAAGPGAAAAEILIAVVATDGPPDDNAGTWGNSFTAGQRVGQIEIGNNPVTLADGYRVVSSIDTYTASKSGIASRDWVMVIAGFTAP